jgi:hypothetical protein
LCRRSPKLRERWRHQGWQVTSADIIAGGSFTKINGAGRPHVAEMRSDGTLVDKATFAATADGDVQALATGSCW